MASPENPMSLEAFGTKKSSISAAQVSVTLPDSGGLGIAKSLRILRLLRVYRSIKGLKALQGTSGVDAIKAWDEW